jgi:hypothetical protein
VRYAILVIAFVLTIACSPETPEPDADGTWVGTITTEGNVTTVVNDSGSVWGGTARLVEEASIGVQAGADEYMLGQISSVYATDDCIYVVDSQVPAVRVYDHGGTFVRNLGGRGQGPGEFTAPTILTADEDGRVYVLDGRLYRINVYSATGEIADTWRFPDAWCCRPMYPLTGEAVWATVRQGDPRDFHFGLQAVGPDGPYGDITWIPEIDYERATFKASDGGEATAPFGAFVVWNPAPDGRLLVGATNTYRFEVHEPDGSKSIVQRFWEPVPVPAEHREWERRRKVAGQRQYIASLSAHGLAEDDPDFTWDGAEIPNHKPAYSSLIPALSGETWVVRWGASVRLADCVEDPIDEGLNASYERPCWDNENIVDVFGADGRYLGEVDLPDDVNPDANRFSVDDRRIVTLVEDANGVARVKRYRLVLPREQ